MSDLWIGVFKVRHEGSVVLDATIGRRTWGYAYYLNAFMKNNEPALTRVMVVCGEDAQDYLTQMRTEPRIIVKRVDGNKLFYSVRVVDTYHALVLTDDFFFIKPIYWKNGFEYWTVASYDKKVLAKLPTLATKRGGQIKLISIHKGTVDLFLPTALSDLTAKQLQAFTKASASGYYVVPRKTSVKKLAQVMRVPESTFREHLRKAEAKILSSIIEKPV